MLAAVLAEWRLSGWSAMFGRQPGPDDLIVPLPPADARRRTKRRDAEPFRGDVYTRKRWVEVDEQLLGWRHREVYCTKSTFITLAIDDGAAPAIIRDRVTHTKPRRNLTMPPFGRFETRAPLCRRWYHLRVLPPIFS